MKICQDNILFYILRLSFYYKLFNSPQDDLPLVDFPFPAPLVPLAPPPPVEDVDEDLSWPTDDPVSLPWLTPPPSKLKNI